jgi:hypothetical protein
MNASFRKLLLLCAVMASAVVVGCGDDDVKSQPQNQQREVEFKVEDLQYDSVMVTVTPPSNDIVYYACLHPDVEDFMGREPEEIYLDIRYGDNFDESLQVGTQTLTFDNLIGHSRYRVVYFAFDEAVGQKIGDIIYSEPIVTPDAPELFDIEVSDIEGMSARITITPPESDMRYFFWLYTLDSYERYQHCNDYELLRYDYSFWLYISQLYNYSLEEVITMDTIKGKVSLSTDNILYIAEWDTEYLVWAYGINTDGTVTTPITRKVFKTLAPEPSTMTFEVPNIETEWYEQTTSEGLLRGWVAKATIKPSAKSEKYFVTITNKDWYDWYFTSDNDGRSDDDYIAHQILINTSKTSTEVVSMCKSGDFVYDCFVEREILLKPDREYAVFIFGMDENGATTELNVFPFTTPSMPQ